MIGPDEGWAVGSVVLHYLRGRWSEEPAIPDGYDPLLFDVDFLSSDYGWTVGGQYALEFRSGVWGPRSPDLGSPDLGSQGRLKAVGVTPWGDAWAAGWPQVWRFDGQNWSSVTLPQQGPLGPEYSSVDVEPVDGGCEIWLAGSYDTVVRVRLSAPGAEPVTPVATATSEPTPTTGARPGLCFFPWLASRSGG